MLPGLVGTGFFGGATGIPGLFSSGQVGGWYDFSDLSTMWQDTAGTTPVTTAGQSIARVDDKSGNGRHLTQSTAASRPTYQNSGGLHWADFDGGDILLSSTFALEAQPIVVALAAKFDTMSSSRGTQHIFDGGTSREAIYQRSPGSDGLYLYAGLEIDAQRQLTTDPFVIASEFNGSSSKYRYNGSQLYSGYNPSTIGLTQYRLGGSSSGTAFMDGRVYGAIIRNSLFSSGETSTVESYLAGLCGVTGLGTGYSVKLVCSSANNANGDVLFREVQMRTSHGGSDATGSGAAGGTQGWYSLDEGPKAAFDNSTATQWQARTGGTSCELIYHFGPSYAGGAINELFIDAHPSFLTRTPASISVYESSDGGATYGSAVATFTGMTSWAATATLSW